MHHHIEILKKWLLQNNLFLENAILAFIDSFWIWFQSHLVFYFLYMSSPPILFSLAILSQLYLLFFLYWMANILRRWKKIQFFRSSTRVSNNNKLNTNKKIASLTKECASLPVWPKIFCKSVQNSGEKEKEKKQRSVEWI